MPRRRRQKSHTRDATPFDATRTVGGIAGFEAGTGIAHGPLAVLLALVLALLVHPIRRALRAWFRQ